MSKGGGPCVPTRKEEGGKIETLQPERRGIERIMSKGRQKVTLSIKASRG